MYVIVWEFLVGEGQAGHFEEANRAGGVWPRFFSQHAGYLGSEVLRDGRRYLTLDRWISRDAYEQFRDAQRAEYDRIDRRLAGISESERHLGSFVQL
jgi:heme-degrading monooxygenase HmoA